MHEDIQNDDEINPQNTLGANQNTNNINKNVFIKNAIINNLNTKRNSDILIKNKSMIDDYLISTNILFTQII